MAPQIDEHMPAMGLGVFGPCFRFLKLIDLFDPTQEYCVPV